MISYIFYNEDARKRFYKQVIRYKERNSMQKIKIQPLADRIVIVPVSEKKTLSGIIIPETHSKERPEKGEVVAVGPGRISDDGKRITPEVKVGDIVVFAKYGPEEVKVDGVDYFILREDQILAVIK